MEKNIVDLEQKYNINIPDSRVKSWEIQMDLWKEFDAVCKKHNLRYFVMFGALLGAVRHKGFIPWDDDIDVVMLREEYDKLMEYEYEFSYPYYLQTPSNSKNADYSNILLINEETSCVNKKILSKEQRQGMKLDIVPLDVLPDNKMIYKCKQFVFKFVRTGLYISHCDYTKLGFKTKILANIYKIIYMFMEREMVPFTIEKIRKNLTQKESGKVGEIGHGLVFDREDFTDVVYLDFEEYKVPAPIGYDHILKELYGDYMAPPQIIDRQQSAYESDDYFSSPYISYKEYIKNGDTK